MHAAFITGPRPSCDDCARRGWTPERIRIVGQYKDPDGIELFYDAEGRFHRHDPNPTITTCECSFGHRWDVPGPVFSCASCGAGPHTDWEDRSFGLGISELHGVFDAEHHLIGVSVLVDGNRQRWMVPLQQPPVDAISLAWPAR